MTGAAPAPESLLREGGAAMSGARADRPARLLDVRARAGVVIAWVVIAAGLGFFAPRAEHALSGAGWEASDSESVAARDKIDSAFGGQSGSP